MRASQTKGERAEGRLLARYISLPDRGMSAGLGCWSVHQSRFVFRTLPRRSGPLKAGGRGRTVRRRRSTTFVRAAETVRRPGSFEIPFEQRFGRDEFRSLAEARLTADQNGSGPERK